MILLEALLDWLQILREYITFLKFAVQKLHCILLAVGRAANFMIYEVHFVYLIPRRFIDDSRGMLSFLSL